MKEFFRSKAVKATAVVLLVAIVIVVAFFGLYGIAQCGHSSEGNKKIYSSVETYDWQNSDTFDISEYSALRLDETKELNVLMLTDTHFYDGGWYAKNFWVNDAYNRSVYRDIRIMVESEKPDFIYLTGDIQTDKLNDIIMEEFAAFMDGFEIPWTMTFGNHDSENRADKATIANILLNAEHCIFQVGPTNLQGLGNSVIPLLNAAGEVEYAFILMDFGDWQQRNDPNKVYSTIDAGVTDKQIEWYKWVVDGLKTTAGKPVNTALLAHLPMHANTYAVKIATYEANENDRFLYNDDPFETESEFGYVTKAFDDYRARYRKEGFRGEGVITRETYKEYKENDVFYKTILDIGSTDQLISGHNHCDGYSVMLDGITFTSVVKTGDIYVDGAADNNFRGGTAFCFAFGTNAGITSRPINAKAMR